MRQKNTAFKKFEDAREAGALTSIASRTAEVTLRQVIFELAWDSPIPAVGSSNAPLRDSEESVH